MVAKLTHSAYIMLIPTYYKKGCRCICIYQIQGHPTGSASRILTNYTIFRLHIIRMGQLRGDNLLWFPGDWKVTAKSTDSQPSYI